MAAFRQKKKNSRERRSGSPDTTSGTLPAKSRANIGWQPGRAVTLGRAAATPGSHAAPVPVTPAVRAKRWPYHKKPSDRGVRSSFRKPSTSRSQRIYHGPLKAPLSSFCPSSHSITKKYPGRRNSRHGNRRANNMSISFVRPIGSRVRTADQVRPPQPTTVRKKAITGISARCEPLHHG